MSKLLTEEELRKKITQAKDNLGGRIELRKKVSRLQRWSDDDLQQVIVEDGWIFEDEILSLINQQVLEALGKVKEGAIVVKVESIAFDSDYKLGAVPLSSIEEIEEEYK